MTTSATQLWFENRSALVTGAGAGVGRAVAIALGQAGANVGVHYRSNAQGADAVCREIEAVGGKAKSLQADLTDPQAAERLFAEFDQHVSDRLDMLVNNAGDWMDKQPIVDCPVEQWRRMFEINATSVFTCCRLAVRRMLPHGDGGIVNIGSVAGITGGGGGTVPYAAAKAAVHTLTRGLAREVAAQGIRVNAVAPGMVDTAMLEGRVTEQSRRALEASTPVGRFAQPEEIASVVLMLLSPSASYMAGQVVNVNGGLLMP